MARSDSSEPVRQAASKLVPTVEETPTDNGLGGAQVNP